MMFLGIVFEAAHTTYVSLCRRLMILADGASGNKACLEDKKKEVPKSVYVMEFHIIWNLD